ncbi:zinc finger domain-containing protein [uncultured Clostridium sp.]
MKKCENCGSYIKSKSNKTKYCPSCAKEIEKENTKIRVRKYRELHNITK